MHALPAQGPLHTLVHPSHCVTVMESSHPGMQQGQALKLGTGLHTNPFPPLSWSDSAPGLPAPSAGHSRVSLISLSGQQASLLSGRWLGSPAPPPTHTRSLEYGSMLPLCLTRKEDSLAEDGGAFWERQGLSWGGVRGTGRHLTDHFSHLQYSLTCKMGTSGPCVQGLRGGGSRVPIKAGQDRRDSSAGTHF